MHGRLVYSTVNSRVSAALTLKWCLRAYSEQLQKMLLVQKSNSQSRVAGLSYFIVVDFVLILAINKKQITDCILLLRLIVFFLYVLEEPN